MPRCRCWPARCRASAPVTRPCGWPTRCTCASRPRSISISTVLQHARGGGGPSGRRQRLGLRAGAAAGTGPRAWPVAGDEVRRSGRGRQPRPARQRARRAVPSALALPARRRRRQRRAVFPLSGSPCLRLGHTRAAAAGAARAAIHHPERTVATVEDWPRAGPPTGWPTTPPWWRCCSTARTCRPATRPSSTPSPMPCSMPACARCRWR